VQARLAPKRPDPAKSAPPARLPHVRDAAVAHRRFARARQLRRCGDPWPAPGARATPGRSCGPCARAWPGGQPACAARTLLRPPGRAFPRPPPPAACVPGGGAPWAPQSPVDSAPCENRNIGARRRRADPPAPARCCATRRPRHRRLRPLCCRRCRRCYLRAR